MPFPAQYRCYSLYIFWQIHWNGKSGFSNTFGRTFVAISNYNHAGFINRQCGSSESVWVIAMELFVLWTLIVTQRLIQSRIMFSTKRKLLSLQTRRRHLWWRPFLYDLLLFFMIDECADVFIFFCSKRISERFKHPSKTTWKLRALKALPEHLPQLWGLSL